MAGSAIQRVVASRAAPKIKIACGCAHLGSHTRLDSHSRVFEKRLELRRYTCPSPIATAPSNSY